MDYDSPLSHAGAAAGAIPTGGTATGTAAEAKDGGKSAFLQTLEEIRDKGLQAYAEEQQAKKLEEMRRKILESMGLTEEGLAALPPERRAAVEKMVSAEIEKRLAATALMNGEKEADDPAALARATTNGLGAGLAMLEAMEARFERY